MDRWVSEWVDGTEEEKEGRRAGNSLGSLSSWALNLDCI